MPITAQFINRWANVYELRSQQVSAEGGGVYARLLPAGLRHTLATSWDVESQLLATLAGNVVGLTLGEFLEVCYWKTRRVISTAAKNTAPNVTAVTAAAFAAMAAVPANRAAAIAVLVSPGPQLNRLKGVRVPVASALLTMAYPDEATVLDIRALSTLYRNGELAAHPDPLWAGVAGVAAREPRWPPGVPPLPAAVATYRQDADMWWGDVKWYWLSHYGDYVSICLGIVARCGGPPLTLRQLDRALWAAGGSTGTP
jgi:hypothetical protein